MGRWANFTPPATQEPERNLDNTPQHNSRLGQKVSQNQNLGVLANCPNTGNAGRTKLDASKTSANPPNSSIQKGEPGVLANCPTNRAYKYTPSGLGPRQKLLYKSHERDQILPNLTLSDSLDPHRAWTIGQNSATAPKTHNPSESEWVSWLANLRQLCRDSAPGDVPPRRWKQALAAADYLVKAGWIECAAELG